MTLEITNDNIDEIVSNDVVLVDFWAPWCRPCAILMPAIEQIANDYVGRVIVGKVNVDDVPELAEKYGIRGIPSVLIIKKGNVISTTVGSDKKKVIDALESALQ